MLADGRWLLGEFFNRGPYIAFDPDTRETRPIHDGPGTLGHARDEGLEIVTGVSCCVDADWGRTEGELWLVDLEGEREQLAPRVTLGYEWLSDGRLLTPLDVGGDWTGKLVVVDPDSLAEAIVDEDVLTANTEIGDDDEILYAVVDGDRTGVWITKLAPRE